jgi:hypothetical protein
LIETHYGGKIAGHISRDATAIHAREKAGAKPKPPPKPRRGRRGSRRKDDPPAPPPNPTRLQRQLDRDLKANLADLLIQAGRRFSDNRRRQDGDGGVCPKTAQYRTESLSRAVYLTRNPPRQPKYIAENVGSFSEFLVNSRGEQLAVGSWQLAVGPPPPVGLRTSPITRRATRTQYRLPWIVVKESIP